MGANLMSSNLGVSVEECKEMLNTFFEMFPSVKEFTLQNEEDAKNIGFVEDYMGRRRHLPDASLPQISVVAKKDLYTNADCFMDCDNDDIKISVVDHEKTAELNKKWKELEESKIRANLFEKKRMFKEEYSWDKNVSIRDNGNFISRALTQCTNARIQGSAASLTKKAMVKISNDIRMKELGFRILVPVHDELLGECPVENSEEVEKRLAQLMIEAAKPECSVSMKVDTYRVNHWYADEVSNKVRSKYAGKIEKGMSDEEAIISISKEFPEISVDVLTDMCHGEYDCLEEKI
jgi:DNA polymerase I-like protein with 3'-5' exonuclease and polymerase domains